MKILYERFFTGNCLRLVTLNFIIDANFYYKIADLGLFLYSHSHFLIILPAVLEIDTTSGLLSDCKIPK